jgi:pectate lyase
MAAATAMAAADLGRETLQPGDGWASMEPGTAGGTLAAPDHDTAVIRGGWFDIRGTSAVPATNIIIRNLTFRDTFDCFPQWDPTDGSTGNESAIFAENNFFWTNGTETPDQFIEVFKGTAIHEEGTLVDEPADKNLTDVLGDYNAVNDPDLSDDVGWTPTLFLAIDRTRHVLPEVRATQASSTTKGTEPRRTVSSDSRAT